MSISREQVRQIAALARLHLTEAETETYAAQLSDILAHVDDLETAPADAPAGVSPPESGRLRADVLSADPLHRPPADFAPRWAEGFFTVPRLDAMDSDEPAQ